MPVFVNRKVGSLLILVTAVVLAAGCGGGIRKITVSGTVSYGGKKLTSGLLQFVGENSYSAAPIQPDGKYIMTDVLPGEVKVAVMETPQSSGSSGGTDAPAPKVAPVSVPEKFRFADKSGVKLTIAQDTRELHIDLK